MPAVRYKKTGYKEYDFFFSNGTGRVVWMRNYLGYTCWKATVGDYFRYGPCRKDAVMLVLNDIKEAEAAK